MPQRPIPIDTVKALLGDGLNMTQIAGRLGVTRTSIWRACCRHGVPTVYGHRQPKPAPVAKPEKPRDPMAGVRFDDDPRALRPMSGALPPRQFEWRTPA